MLLYCTTIYGVAYPEGALISRPPTSIVARIFYRVKREFRTD